MFQLKENRSVGWPTGILQGDIKEVKETDYECVEWLHLAQGKGGRQALCNR
jgi:hypothetical protein